jgi:hypothetical protein
MSSIINDVILGILALATLREVIAMVGIVPRYRKWSWLIYNKYDDTVIAQTLGKLGLSLDDIKERISKPKYHGQFLDKLICLCINNITKSEDETASYGADRNNSVSSQYYINTMEASHDKEDLDTMIDCIVHLSKKKLPDFIITPKFGNSYLSAGIGRRFPNVKTILVKDPSDGSYWHGESSKSEVNFEGINKLVDYSRVANKELYGIAIDDNASRCTTIQETIKMFNETICSKYPNIKKIDEALVLFRVKTDEIDGDIKVHRYFDLDEDMKQYLWEKRQGIGRHLFSTSTEDTPIIKEIRDNLEKKKLIKGG